MPPGKTVAKHRNLENVLMSNGSNSSVASIGTLKNSKSRLLANNKSLALLLNKKKLEIRSLRDANRQLTASLGQYKHACKTLLHKMQTTNNSIRNLQNAAPVIFRDISNALNRYENMRNVLAALDLEEIDNQSFLNNISHVEQNSLKGKLPRKRTRVINKVRPMKYGLVLGNPVVSLHRLRPPLEEVVETEEYTTDTEVENNDDEIPDNIDAAGTASGHTSPNSPVSTQTHVTLTPHHLARQTLAELTLSVPLLQSIEARVSPNKRPRLSEILSPSRNSQLLKQQEIQLKTPCRVIIENLRHDQSSPSKENRASVLETSLSSFPSVHTPNRLTPTLQLVSSEKKRKRMGRPKKIRKAFSDGEAETPSKKLSDEELKKKLTPLQVKVKLNKLSSKRIETPSPQNTDHIEPTSLKRKPRKSLPSVISNFTESESDEETDSELNSLVKNKDVTLSKKLQIDSSKITKRGRVHGKSNLTTNSSSKRKSVSNKPSPILKVKMWSSRDLPSSRKRTVTFSEVETDSEDDLPPTPSKLHSNSKKALNTSKKQKSPEKSNNGVEILLLQPERKNAKKNINECFDRTIKPASDLKDSKKAQVTKNKFAQKNANVKTPKDTHESLASDDELQQQERNMKTGDTVVNKETLSAEDDLRGVDMELDSGLLNTTYVIEKKKISDHSDVSKLNVQKPCPKSKKVPALKPVNLKEISSVKNEESIKKSPLKTTSEKSQNLAEPSTKQTVTKSKKVKPMPLSKKLALGMLNSEDLEILHEKISAPTKTHTVKQEPTSPTKEDEEAVVPRTQTFMSSFLQRLSGEDPLEGTSRQHVYKKPKQPSPKDSEPMKKSLRLLEKKTYEESPLSDCPPTDDEWRPPKDHCHKKK